MVLARMRRLAAFQPRAFMSSRLRLRALASCCSKAWEETLPRVCACADFFNAFILLFVTYLFIYMEFELFDYWISRQKSEEKRLAERERAISELQYCRRPREGGKGRPELRLLLPSSGGAKTCNANKNKFNAIFGHSRNCGLDVGPQILGVA